MAWTRVAPIVRSDHPRTVDRVTAVDPQYTIAQAAAMLGRAPTTLRDQVTRREVPHHRRGKVKGVYFTVEDITAILEADRRPVGTPHVAAASPGTDPTSATRPTVIPAEFARIRRAR